MKTLFVGGSYDGETHDVEPLMDMIQMPIRVDPDEVDYALGPKACNKVVMAECYKREILASSERRYSVYVLMSDDKVDLIERLLQGYRRASNEGG